MAKPIVGMIPPGGWHFIQSDVKLTAHSIDDLYKVVEDFRVQNNFPLGDVQGDVDNYLCGNYPNYCHGVDHVSINVMSKNRITASAELLQDITTWGNNVLRSPNKHPLVSDEEAERRAKICISCPSNANWRSGCSSCIVSADRICAAVRQGRETKTTRVLGGCHQLRHDNRTAVFLDKEVLATSGNLPSTCWLT